MQKDKFHVPMWVPLLSLLAIAGVGIVTASTDQANQPTFSADDKRFEYMGRVDFTNPKLPRFWSPGVTISSSFTGTYCDVLLNDEMAGGNTHNYVEIIVDGIPLRYRDTGKTNIIQAATGLADRTHTITICKDTESGNGYLEFVGLRCQGLANPQSLPKRRIEFIGDSITVGYGNDTSDVPCSQGEWYAKHDAYMSYGPQSARLLNSQWMINAVSGIGITHSYAGGSNTMPPVYDQIANRQASATDPAGASWDFERYQPDVITVCLGQNDGVKYTSGANADTFIQTYEAFIVHLRTVYPKAEIVLLTSPMGDPDLTKALKQDLDKIVSDESAQGDKHISTFAFSRSWNDGCDGHPTVASDIQIAGELTPYLKTLMHW